LTNLAPPSSQEITRYGLEQQCPGKDEPGDQEANPGGWQLAVRAIRLDAGVGQVEACCGDPVGCEAISGYGQASKPKPKKVGS